MVFFLTLKNILYNIGIVKRKSFSFKEENIFIKNNNNESKNLFSLNINNINTK